MIGRRVEQRRKDGRYRLREIGHRRGTAVDGKRSVFDLGMTEFDSFYLYMPMRPAQDYLDMFDRVLKPGASVPPLDATEEQREAAYDRLPEHEWRDRVGHVEADRSERRISP